MLFLGGIMILKNDLKHKKSHNIFDIDGTLTFFDGIKDLVSEAMSCYGYNDKCYNELQYKAVHIILEKSIKNKNFFNMDNYVQIHKKVMGLKEENAFNVVNKMLELTSKYTKIFPNVNETLEQLSGDAICSTNWFKKVQLEKLRKVSIEHYFRRIYTCEGLNAKPSKKHFRYILKEEDFNPKNCVMIGDSKSDLGASKVGIETILVDYNQNKQELYKDADAVITEFSDLKKILRR